MSDPLVPNFKKGVGRLATDRFDFEDHIEGKRFRHQANQIDLIPTLVIGGNPQANVQDALATLATLVAPPVVPNASFTVTGIIRLTGDLNASVSGGTATNPKVTGIQGFPIATTAPTSGYVLTWTGSTWSPQPIVSSFTPGIDLAGSDVAQTVIGLTGTGSSPSATINAKCDIIQFIDTATPTITQTQTTTADAADILIRAQDSTFGNGGNVVLVGGEGNTYGGGFALKAAVSSYMVEGAVVENSGFGSLVLGLVNGNAVSTGNMPANTGSQVIFIGDTSSPPTSGSPVDGTILYSNGGKLFIKQVNSAQFVISPNYLPTRTISSSSSFGVGDVVILVDTTTLAISVTLPTPESGRRVVVKDSKGFAATNNISVLRSGAEKIEGLAATKVISANWGSLTLDSDGTDWFII
jgi:hypothetical protein